MRERVRESERKEGKRERDNICARERESADSMKEIDFIGEGSVHSKQKRRK